MAQQFKPLWQERLNVGTERVWVQSPGRGKLRSTQIGLHTVARGRRSYDADWTPGAISAGGKASTTLTVPDVEAGDVILASHSKILTNYLRITGHYSAADTIRAVIHNPTAASVTVPAGSLRVIVFPFVGDSVPCTVSVDASVDNATPAVDEEVNFSATVTGGVAPFTYDWEFEDGDPTGSALEDPPWTYTTDGFKVATLVVTDAIGCTAQDTVNVLVDSPYDPMGGSFTAVATGAFTPGGGVLTLTPTITGGSGNFTYAWSAWTEWGGSEGAPAFTDTDEIGIWSPLYSIAESGICNAEAKLIVTDTETLEELEIGPESWTWSCV